MAKVKKAKKPKHLQSNRWYEKNIRDLKRQIEAVYRSESLDEEGKRAEASFFSNDLSFFIDELESLKSNKLLTKARKLDLLIPPQDLNPLGMITVDDLYKAGKKWELNQFAEPRLSAVGRNEVRKAINEHYATLRSQWSFFLSILTGLGGILVAILSFVIPRH